MISQPMQDAMNAQIKHETFSAYLYFSMAAFFHTKGLDGMAHWMKVQAQEEFGHALRFFNHIISRGGRVELQAIDQPEMRWDSPREAFKAALKHEQFITGKIHDLARLADTENDRAANIMLQWFVSEQVEEEESVNKVLDMLEIVGEKGPGLLLADRELAQRVVGAILPPGETL